MSRSTIDLRRLVIRPLLIEDAEVLGGFACGDEDLDDFVRTDAPRLQDQSVVKTFVALYGGQLVGYISLLADAVELKTNERKKLTLNSEDHPVVPALKIARLAVDTRFKATNEGLGTALVRFAYVKAIELATFHLGCRLLTLDAYPESIAFYEKLDFVRNGAKAYEGRKHPSMRLDVFGRTQPRWISGAAGLRTPSEG